MFSVGQELYRLTQRDEETLLVDPFFRRIVVPILSGTDITTQLITVPLDRCLYLHTMNIVCPATVGAAFTGFAVTTRDTSTGALAANLWNCNQGASAFGMQGDNAPPPTALGGDFQANRLLELLLPPALSLQVIIRRTNVALQSDCSVNITGYLIPPGRIGRGS